MWSAVRQGLRRAARAASRAACRMPPPWPPPQGAHTATEVADAGRRSRAVRRRSHPPRPTVEREKGNDRNDGENNGPAATLLAARRTSGGQLRRRRRQSQRRGGVEAARRGSRPGGRRGAPGQPFRYSLVHRVHELAICSWSPNIWGLFSCVNFRM